MKKLILVVTLLCACLAPLPAQEVDANLIDAVTLYSNGQYKQAQALLQTLGVAAPNNDAVWYYLALSCFQLRDLEGAASAVQKAVALDSTNYWYRRLQARTSLLRGQPEEGIAQYESIVKDFPDNSSAPYELLDLYLGNKQYQKALDVLEEIERQHGLSEEIVRTRYDVYTAMGRQDEGAEQLEKFNAQYSLPSVLSMLGDYYLADYRDSLALERYKEALSLDSAYIPALLGESEVYRHMRRYPDYFNTLMPFFASEDIPAQSKSMYIGNLTRSLDPKILQNHRAGFDSLVVKAGAMHPTDSTLLSTIGSYYYSTGREKEAGKWFGQAASQYPQSLTQTLTYIQYLHLQQQWEPLREQALEAYARFNELGFLDYANVASYNLEDYDGVITTAKLLLARYPANKDVCLSAWSQLGDAYHSKGDEKCAFKAYNKALRLNPDYAPVLNNYAYYLSLQGRKLKKAYNMSKKTIEQEPDNATYLDTFAWILHLMGKDLEAKPFFKHAMLYGGKDSAVILRHYATVLEALGEKDSAQVYLKQAQRLDPDGHE